MLRLRFVNITALLLSLNTIDFVAAAVIYVDDTAPPSGGNNGTSWRDAYTDLHDGLKAAQSGDEVRIAQGLYRPAPPNGDRTISFQLKSAVVVQGGFAGFDAPDPDALDPTVYITILSGDLNGDDGPIGSFENLDENAYNVVMADGAIDVQLRGVTITGGNANLGASGCKLGGVHDAGGGLCLTNNSTMLVSDVVMVHNQASCWGGAIMLRPGNSSLEVEQSVFRWNRRVPTGGGSGGAIMNFSAGELNISDCLFEKNGFWVDNGGAVAGANLVRSSTFIDNVAGEGGALVGVRDAVVDCTFIGNESGLIGGAILSGGCDIINCTFLKNGAGGIDGGAAIYTADARIINCLFSGHENVAVTITTATPTSVINSTFVGNNSFSNQGAILAAQAQVDIANCILWDNAGDADSDQQQQLGAVNGASFAVSNTIIEGWDGTLGGTNNSGNDPLFIDADGPDNIYGTKDDDPRLSATSPAIDAGDNALLPADAFDLDQDGDTNEPIPLDLDLHTRVVNDIVDLGAFEFDGQPIGCAADVAPQGSSQGDGSVDVDDLLFVINNWGATGNNAADITGNGVVNVDDLLAVINAWGPCE